MPSHRLEIEDIKINDSIINKQEIFGIISVPNFFNFLYKKALKIL